jgi:hypothetical protein
LASKRGGLNPDRRLDEDAMDNKPGFTEHRIPSGQGGICAHDYDGAGPAFVLMHGFPDNLHIYDGLIPHLTKAGRRVVAENSILISALRWARSGRLISSTVRSTRYRRGTGCNRTCPNASPS